MASTSSLINWPAEKKQISEKFKATSCFEWVQNLSFSQQTIQSICSLKDW